MTRLPILFSALAALALPARAAQEPLPTRILHRHSAILSEEKDVQKVAIGDAEIVDVVIIKRREILVSAKSPGRTNVILWYSDETRKDRVVQVELDLGPLREQLAMISDGITVETSPDGKFIILRGSVATIDIMNAAGDAAVSWMDAGHSREIPSPRKDTAEKPETAEKRDLATGPEEPGRAAKVVNMIIPRLGLVPMEDRIRYAARPFCSDLQIHRIQQVGRTDEQRDTFVLEGTVSSQTALTQALIVIDRVMGGPGTDFKVLANEGGGLNGITPPPAPPAASGSNQQSTSGGGLGSQLGGILSQPTVPLSNTSGQLPKNNLGSNIARGSAVMGKTGRWVSFLKVRSLPQVLVSVRVLQLDRQKMRTLGMDWNAMIQNHAPIPGQFAQRKDSLSIISGLLTNSFTVTDKKFLLNQVITALETQGYARTLSEPNLATLSGEVATFLSGGDVPIKTLTATTSTTFGAFQFIEFGIRLTIRPLVGEDGRTITLDINPEVSAVVPDDPTNPQGAPSFTRTTLLSTAQLKDGEGLIVGGLIGKKDDHTRQQVPVLGDIPILGNLFSKTSDTESDTELALILIPKIIYPRPANSFALEPPHADHRVRGGAFIDPDLGRLPSVPEFYRRLATGEIEYR